MNKAYLYSNLKLTMFGQILLAIVPAGLLMGLCIILFLIETFRSIPVKVVFIAVLEFSITISNLHEVFGATAAYAALLIVFLGIHSS